MRTIDVIKSGLALMLLTLIILISYVLIKNNIFDEKCILKGGTPIHFRHNQNVCFSNDVVIKI